MAVDDDGGRSDRKEQKHKHKHKERDRDRDKDRDKGRDRDRERARDTGKDADVRVLERGSSHKSDRDREHKRDRRDRHRDQGEDSKDRHTENAADHGRKSPRPEQKSDSPSTAIAAEGAVPAGPSDSTAEPAAIRPQVQDSGGEVSMSIEETNRSVDWLEQAAEHECVFVRLINYVHMPD